MVKKYGQTVLVTQDLALENYLDRYMRTFSILSSFLSARAEFSNRFKVSVKCWMIEPFITLPIEWLLTGSVTQLVLAIISKDTRTPLERWVFDIKLVEQPADPREP